MPIRGAPKRACAATTHPAGSVYKHPGRPHNQSFALRLAGRRASSFPGTRPPPLPHSEYHCHVVSVPVSCASAGKARACATARTSPLNAGNVTATTALLRACCCVPTDAGATRHSAHLKGKPWAFSFAAAAGMGTPTAARNTKAWPAAVCSPSLTCRYAGSRCLKRGDAAAAVAAAVRAALRSSSNTRHSARQCHTSYVGAPAHSGHVDMPHSRPDPAGRATAGGAASAPRSGGTNSVALAQSSDRGTAAEPRQNLRAVAMPVVVA